MGLFDWWRQRNERAELARESVRISEDQDAIAEHAPELVGMDFVEGGAFILREIEAFNATATPDESAELAGRLMGSQRSWAADGLTMPYWANLVVLRRLQAELGKVAD